MQQQQKAQKIGNQSKRRNAYAKIKFFLELSLKANQCVVTKKPIIEKNSAQPTQHINASQEYHIFSSVSSVSVLPQN